VKTIQLSSAIAGHSITCPLAADLDDETLLLKEGNRAVVAIVPLKWNAPRNGYLRRSTMDAASSTAYSALPLVNVRAS